MANMGPIAQEIAVVNVKMMGTIVIISTAAVTIIVYLYYMKFMSNSHQNNHIEEYVSKLGNAITLNELAIEVSRMQSVFR